MRVDGGDGRGARAHERIEHEVAAVGVELDQSLWELDRERGRVADATGALGGDVPHVGRPGHEVFFGDRVLIRKITPVPFRLGQRPIEATLGRDHHPLGEVAEHRVRCALEASPRHSCPKRLRLCATRSRPGAATRGLPRGCGSRRPASDRYGLRPRLAMLTAMRPPGSSFSRALGEHVAEHREVVDVGGRDVAFAQGLLVLLAREVRAVRSRRGPRSSVRVTASRHPSGGRRGTGSSRRSVDG